MVQVVDWHVTSNASTFPHLTFDDWNDRIGNLLLFEGVRICSFEVLEILIREL